MRGTLLRDAEVEAIVTETATLFGILKTDKMALIEVVERLLSNDGISNRDFARKVLLRVKVAR